jgi:hypothetical protein
MILAFGIRLLWTMMRLRALTRKKKVSKSTSAKSGWSEAKGV